MHTGLPGKRDRLSTKRANCIDLARIVRNPVTVNVTKV